MCKQLKLQPGDRLILNIEPDGSLRLVILRQSVQKLQGIFKEIALGISLADQLIQERRPADLASPSMAYLQTSLYIHIGPRAKHSGNKF